MNGLVPICGCCECRGIHCLIPHPGHSHRAVMERDMATFLAALPDSKRREEELWRMVENLQDALHKVEWIRRAPDNKWACAFCGGEPIEHGGDDHREGCEWQRLMRFGPKDLDAVPPQPTAEDAT